MSYYVGVIGCGRWGMKHIHLLEMKKQGRINQVFACDINPKRRILPQSVDGKFSSWREMCSKISFNDLLVTVLLKPRAIFQVAK